MQQLNAVSSRRSNQLYILLVAIILAAAVFGVTLVSISQSRQDSMRLLVEQGTAFAEALAQAAENAIESESFFDYLVYLRFHDMVSRLSREKMQDMTEEYLSRRAEDYDLVATYVFSVDSSLLLRAAPHGDQLQPPDFVFDEVYRLIADPEKNYVILLDQGDGPGEAYHYYIEMTNELDRVLVFVDNAHYYLDALRQTQIGYLAQKMARERGVEYILYQSTDGIIFSSRRTGELLAIESDEFLTAALGSDTIQHRMHQFEDDEVLELVRPFSTREYPLGLLRVGLSLRPYFTVSKSFDNQMITLSGLLVVILLVLMLYLNSRHKRRTISDRYREIKSVTDRLFDEMRTGVAALSSDGTITFANGSFADIMGVSDAVGADWNEFIKTPDLTTSSVISSRTGSVEEEVSVRAGGSDRELLVAISRLLTDGDDGGCVVVVYDISNLKELERRSARRERLSELGDLAAGVAHEIRNPLNTISIASQRLASEFHPSEKQEEYLDFTSQIRAETRRLNDIITRFLALARDRKPQQERVDVSLLIVDWAGLTRPSAEDAGIKIRLELEEGLEIEADPDGVRQVLANLYNNSKEALDGTSGEIAVAGMRVDGGVEISFADNGPGVPEKLRDKLFTPYFTTKDSGTGLGLPTVHRILTECGGEIRLEPADNNGVSWVIRFPPAHSGQQ